MKNNFTTPSFAKVLKEHGIEIDTPFVYYQESDMDGHLSGINYLGLKCSQGIADVETGEIPEREKAFAISPAYPLTEVLGWLPKGISMQGDFYELTVKFDTRGNLTASYYDDQMGSLYDGERGIYYKADSIKALITQGLTEGWLTKDNLNVNS
jgi:hypothetical protein